MTKQVYTEFASLCESIITETSTAMDMVRTVPGGRDVVKKLHTVGLEHDQEYQNLGKISWSELKDSSYGKWVIIKGDKGVGAIKATHGSYTAYASTGENGGQVYDFSNDRGGNILDFLKGHIGGLRSFYAGSATNTVRKKQGDRRERNTSPSTAQLDKYALMNKFKPLWAKAITAAHADIKGMVVTMIKNDAFEKAKKKLDHLAQLENGLDQLEAGSTNIPDFIEKAVQLGILMAAHHHYPEETGEISSSYRSYSAARSAGPAKLLQDISSGDTKKLGTVLAFFKRSLITG